MPNNDVTADANPLAEFRATDEAQVLEVLERIDAGFRQRDSAAILEHYDDAAVVFDLAPPLSHGLSRAGLDAWFKGWRGPIERQMRDFDVIVSGDLATARGLYHVAATTVDGHPAAWWMRATFCFQRAGVWKIVHEHTSVPFHMDGSFRAATDLNP